MASKAEISERMQVWEAFSEFFLDSELDGSDHERIAKTLAASRYTEAELDDILTYEMYPACKWNMLCVEGEWAGFDRDWIEEKIGPQLNHRPFLRWPFRHSWMYRRHWKVVRPCMMEIRMR